MREADRTTMQEWGLPGRALMETAGRACADHAEVMIGGGRREAVVLAGKGNNGGDGLVTARVLQARGWRVHIVTTATEAEATEDTATNLALLRRLEDDRLRLGDLPDHIPEAGLVVDALLGIGVTGDLREPIAGLAAWANHAREAGTKVLAVDVPSGLDADTGRAAEGTIQADRTVAMGALKAGLLVGDGPQHAGEVHVAEIGIPDTLLREHAASWAASPEWLEAVLPHRAADAHKYSAGRAVCIVGSRAFTGAAVLSTRAAYRAGAGAVICCTPESARGTVDAHNTEVMVDAQPEADGGGLAITAYDGIRERIASADAVLMGCGLGREVETQRLVRVLLRRLAGDDGPPAVLDADGLTALADHTEALAKQAEGRIVLTPHLGELRRLFGDDDFTPKDRLATVRDLATEWNSVLVLKGMPSVLATPDGTLAVGPPGHPALATAGTGDVLAGTTVGLMAQGMAPADAALAALWLGSLAASRFPGRPESMIASDLLHLGTEVGTPGR